MKSVARYWVGADDATIERMKAIVSRLKMSRAGLTQKNRERLLPFNDPEACTKLLKLPLVLRREIERGRLPQHRRRTLGQMAVAIEILLFLPIRMKNLVSLEINRHLIKAGKKLLLTIPAAEVKNNATDLDFELPEPSAELVRWYIKEVRTVEAGNPYLFPGTNGSHRSKSTFGTQITRTVHKYTGLKVNPHLFRHVAAKLFLDHNPGGYEVVRRVLGHARMETTSKFYAGLETRSAARHFDQQILKLRNAEPRRPT
jgi:integrase